MPAYSAAHFITLFSSHHDPGPSILLTCQNNGCKQALGRRWGRRGSTLENAGSQAVGYPSLISLVSVDVNYHTFLITQFSIRYWVGWLTADKTDSYELCVENGVVLPENSLFVFTLCRERQNVKQQRTAVSNRYQPSSLEPSVSGSFCNKGREFETV